MDYNMRLVDRGGGCISSLEYKDFRSTGNAFNFNEEETQEDDAEKAEGLPNNSLISSLVTHRDGDRLSRRGYWGDIITGPFITYGFDYKKEVFFCVFFPTELRLCEKSLKGFWKGPFGNVPLEMSLWKGPS